MYDRKLLLASKSPSRQMLLSQAGIPFMLIGQDADEACCDWNLPLSEVVSQIACYKMEHAIVPKGSEDEVVFVLTADTLSQDMEGTIHGKPADRDDARKKIKAAQAGSVLCTAFCLERKIYQNGLWQTDERIEQVVQTRYRFEVPDDQIDYYLDNSVGLSTANAIAVEGFGLQYLHYVEGSYTAIVGLPLFEVRQALIKLGFFKKNTK